MYLYISYLCININISNLRCPKVSTHKRPWPAMRCFSLKGRTPDQTLGCPICEDFYTLVLVHELIFARGRGQFWSIKNGRLVMLKLKTLGLRGSQLGDGSALPQLHCFSDLSSHKLQRFSVDHPGLKFETKQHQTASIWSHEHRVCVLRVVEIASQCFPCVCAKRFGGEIGWSSAALGQSAQKSPLLCYHIWWTKHAHLPGTYFEVIK